MKKMLSVLLMMAMLSSMLPSALLGASADAAFGSFDEIYESFLEPCGRLMSIAHRAGWRDYPENSLESVEKSIADGVDMIEIDLKTTSDGELVVMHDTTVDRTTNGTGEVKDKTLAQIRELRLREGQGGSSAALTDCVVPTFREVLTACKGKSLINLDHTFLSDLDRLNKAWDMVIELGCEDVVVFKSSDDPSDIIVWLEQKQEEHPRNLRPMYSAMYTNNSANEAQVAADFTSYWSKFEASGKPMPQMIELISDNASTPLVSDEIISRINATTRPMFNNMWDSISAKRSDDPAGWYDFYSHGVNALQTEYPTELADYIRDVNLGKSAYEYIEAKHFAYTDDADKVSVLSREAVKARESAVLMYSGVDFSGGSAQTILAYAATSEESAGADVYIDSVTEANKIGSFSVDATSGYSDFTCAVGAVKAEISGVHNVYLITDNTISIKSFVFLSESAAPKVEREITVSTYKGVMPPLPSRVSAEVLGSRVSLPAVWEYIDKSEYQNEGTFTVKGSVEAFGTDLTATVVISGDAPELPYSQDVLSYFSASSLDLNDGERVQLWKNSVSGASDAKIADDAPIYRAAAVNSAAPAVVFDGVDDSLSFGFDANGMKNISVVMVNTPESGIASDSNNSKLPQGAPMYFHESGDWGQFYIGAFTDYVTLRFGAGNNGYRVRGFRYKREKSVSSYTTTIGVKNLAEEYLYVDGERVAETSDLLEQGKTTDTMQNIAVTGYLGRGGENDHKGWYAGGISELIIYSRSLTEEQVAQVQEYADYMQTPRIADIEQPTVTTQTGAEPQLPQTVSVTKASGESRDVRVAWEQLGADEIASEGEYTVYGTLTGYNLTVKATVKVEKAVDPDPDPTPTPDPTPSTGGNGGTTAGTPANGTATVNGKTILYQNGKAVTGTKVVTVAGKTYAVVKGYVSTGKGNRLVKIGSKTYVVNKSGIIVKGSKNKLVKVGTKHYIVNKKGVVQKGAKNKLVKVGKKKYVVNKKGVVQKNKKSIKVGKKVYKTNKKGVATLKRK